jgi:hypothetical protein
VFPPPDVHALEAEVLRLANELRSFADNDPTAEGIRDGLPEASMPGTLRAAYRARRQVGVGELPTPVGTRHRWT